jgi:UDP-N-acetylglucosamine 2-epimerase (non-hydrolysing)/GDP/UDP-N,N'-diacetylbacillosamine 2-epimerase (hydrolysing)
VDIGDRQRGRLAAASVLHCAPTQAEISATIAKAWTLDCRDVVNPYGDGHSSARIIEALKRLPGKSTLLKKSFHLLEQGVP